MTSKESDGKELCPKPPRVFLREATGLIRQFSWLDALMISAANIAIGVWTISGQIAFVTSADPGADIVMSVHMGFLLSVPVAVTYVLLGIIMPRSGGDYVWVTRLVNRVVGFMVGWGFWIAVLGVAGTLAYVWAIVVLPTFFGSFGYVALNPGLVSLASTFSQPVPLIIAGMFFLILCTVVAGIGGNTFRPAMIFSFALILLSTIVFMGVVAGSTHSDFVNAMNGFGGSDISYQGIMTQAQSAGWTFAPITLAATLLSAPFGVFLFAGQNLSAAAGGEIKTIRKSMWISIVGSLVIAWVVAVVGIQLSLNVFGYDFIQAATFKWPLVGAPYVLFLVSPLVHGNLVLLALMQIGFLISLPWAISAALLVCTRYVFAFSFDRVFPSRLADINEKFHFPLKAAAVNFVGATAFFFLAAFTPYVGLLLNATAIYCLVWAVGSLCAVVIPFKKKELAAVLPGAKWPIPLISIIGVISTAMMLLSLYWAVTTPAVGPSTALADGVLLTILLVGLAVFYVSSSVRRREGIDLKQVYAEIPPE
jgi:amino acid transporter